MDIDTNEVTLQSWSACVMALWRSVAYAIAVDEWHFVSRAKLLFSFGHRRLACTQ